MKKLTPPPASASSSPFCPTVGAFRPSRGFFVPEQNQGLGGFVRVLFVEVERRESGAFLLFVRKAISGIWETVSIVRFFCGHCEASLFTALFLLLGWLLAFLSPFFFGCFFFLAPLFSFSPPFFFRRSSWPD